MKLEAIAPYFGQLSFGFVAGLGTGLASKKIGRTAMVIFGLLFIALQVLAYLKILEINWLRIEHFIEPGFNKTNTARAMNLIWSVISNNLPFAASFTPGFLLGLKKG